MQTLSVSRAPVVGTRCSAEQRPNAARPAPASAVTVVTRREALLGAVIAAGAALLPPAPARAEESSVAVYTDALDKFSISIPAGWQSGEGDFNVASRPATGAQSSRFANNAGLNRVMAWFPPSTPDVSVSVTVAPSSADYTKLGSIADATGFGEMLVAKMDQSYLLRGRRKPGSPPAQIVKLLDARDAGERYFIDYLVRTEGKEEGRVVLSAVALGNTGRMQRFYTVNASCPEAMLATYQEQLRQVVQSFVPPQAS